MAVGSRRDHLFISYAWEDGALAEWLTLRLTGEGYRVWCDRFKILGGERWPADIDDAIRNDTFRMLHLVSSHSLRKENPTKERELALAIQKARGEELLIPLNVDGTKPSDLPFRIVDVAFIPFGDWGQGLSQLLRKLRSVDAPRPLAGSGKDVSRSALRGVEAILEEPEELSSNCYKVTRIPDVLRRFRISRQLTGLEAEKLARRWAFRQVDQETVLAFDHPPADLMVGISFVDRGGATWRHVPGVDGIDSGKLVSELLRKSMVVAAHRVGLLQTPDHRFQFFPLGLLAQDSLKFQGYNRRTRVKVAGYRRLRGVRYRYHLGASYVVRRDMTDDFIIQVRLRVHFCGSEGEQLSARAALVRRKSLARNWWNHQWFNRQLAIMWHLAEGRDEIRIGQDGELVVSAIAIGGVVGKRIDESALEMIGPETIEAIAAVEEELGLDEVPAEEGSGDS